MSTTVRNQIDIHSKTFKNLISKTKEIFSLLFVSSFFLSFNSSLKLYLSFLLFEIDPIFYLIIATFFVTFSVYSLNRLTDKEEDSINMPERIKYVKNRGKIISLLAIMSYSSAIILGLFVSISTIPILLFPLLCGIVYSMKIYRKVRLKDIPVVKSIIVSLSWAVGVAFLPPINTDKSYMLISSVLFFFS